MKTCEKCGQPLTGKYAKRFCSASCRATVMNNIRWARPKEPPKYCRRCNGRIVGPAKMYCSIRCRNIENGKKTPASQCKVCKKAHKSKSGVCVDCLLVLPIGERFRASPRIPWRPEEDEYIRVNYPTKGGQVIADHFGIPRQHVVNRANSLKVCVLSETRCRIAQENSSQRMVENNPMHDNNSLQKMLDWWEDNPEAKENRLNNHLKALQKRDRKNPSGLEKKLHQILNSLEVDYQKSVIIKPKFVVDIMIGTIIIQADGDYWHGHPRFNPLTKRQKSQRAKDRAQDKYLTACGYKVIRIWESDMSRHNVIRILNDSCVL